MITIEKVDWDNCDCGWCYTNKCKAYQVFLFRYYAGMETNRAFHENTRGDYGRADGISQKPE